MKRTDSSLSYFEPAALSPSVSLDTAALKALTRYEKNQIEFINQKIASMDNLKETMEFLFNETQSLLPCDRIGMGFFEEDGRRLRLYHVIANYEPLVISSGYTADVRGSSLEQIFQKETPRIINDIEEYGRNHPHSESTAFLLKEGIRSNMTCPLKVEGRPVALLFRSSRKKNVYGEKEILIHLLISERLSQAVEKAYRIEQLSSAINSYMEMLSFVTHELKSPLDSIITMGKTMIGGYLGDVPEKQRNYVERMVKKAEYLSSIANDYLNLARFESGTARFNPAECEFITEVIAESLDIVMPQLQAQAMVLKKSFSHEEMHVSCDINQLKIVMVNLLSNAVKYGKEKGVIKITVQQDAGTLTVSVWNEGPGFPDEQKIRLFQKFSRIESEELMKQKGSGIGLYTSWKIIQLHNGSIWADSQQGRWAEFSFSLPLNR